MPKFAKTTTVPVARSKAAIIELFEKRGATDYMMGRDNGRDFICCIYEDCRIKLTVPPYDKSNEQEARSSWRVVLLWCKAQFEMIDAGLLEVTGAFLPYLQLPDNRTVAEAVKQDGLLPTMNRALNFDGDKK